MVHELHIKIITYIMDLKDTKDKNDLIHMLNKVLGVEHN